MKSNGKLSQRPLSLGIFIQAAAASWLLCSVFFAGPAHLSQVGHSAEVSLGLFCVTLAVGTGLFFLLGIADETLLTGAVCTVALFCAVLYASAAEETWMVLGLGALTLVGCILVRRHMPARELKAATAKWIVAFSAVAIFAFIGSVTACRYLTFRAPGFDFGIFAQMFESMRTTGLPVTTYERSKVLSHFFVHFSPIYYLMLPLYLLFPNPVTLQLEQAAVVALGLWPLYLLCRKKGLSNTATALLAVCYGLFPVVSGGCLYDLHENCFLLPCLLLLLYGAEAEKEGVFWTGAALTLCIKEDAGIYLAFLALYYLFSRRRVKQSAVLLALAVTVFGITTGYVMAHGDGVIGSRFSNLVPGRDDGMLAVVRTALVHPGYLLSQIFTTEKIQYLLFVLLPFVVLFLAEPHPACIFLLGPMILLNVLPSYKYQYNIDFQYSFGTAVLLFFFAVVQLSKLERKKQIAMALTAASVSLVLFAGTRVEKLWYVEDFLANRERYEAMEETLLEHIPEDASVSASTGLVAHLARHRELYPLEAKAETRFLALDLRGMKEQPSTEGYRLVCRTDQIAIFEKEIE